LLGTDFADVAISSHLLAVKTNGDLYSSGSNYYGQLGLGDTTDRNELTLVGSGYSKVSVNTYHSLAITDAGDLYAFGKNNALDNANPANGSMLGTGDLIEQHSPVFIDSGFSDISAGQLHSLAIKTNGDLYSTGCNVGGTLGVGDYIGRLTFTFIDGPYTYISAGRDANELALRASTATARLTAPSLARVSTNERNREGGKLSTQK
jgi:hypothetical protein